jgi:tRNA G18 (ribose-2'-O)-methylase SpoU
VARVEEPPRGDRPLLALHPEGEELSPGSIPDRAVLAFGSERSGLSEGLLARADLTRSIPMREGVSSLNLGAAVAVTLYAWRIGAGRA